MAVQPWHSHRGGVLVPGALPRVPFTAVPGLALVPEQVGFSPCLQLLICGCLDPLDYLACEFAVAIFPFKVLLESVCTLGDSSEICYPVSMEAQIWLPQVSLLGI